MKSPTTDPDSTLEASGADPLEVCTLPADALVERLAWIREEILPHATRSVRLDGGLALELADAPGVADRVDRLIALERDCCSGIAFERVEGSAPGLMRLEIRGVDPDAPAFRSLQASGAPGTASRLARAAGIGVLGGLLLCCALPLAAGALLGAAAAPLAGLDRPIPILATALVGSAVAWFAVGRRARTGPTSDSSGCGPSC